MVRITSLLLASIATLEASALPTPLLSGEKRGVEAPWYRQSAASDSEALSTRNTDAPWYRQSAASDAHALNADAPWYRQSAASDAEALDKRNADAPWYRQSAASDAEALDQRNADAPWYRQSAASDAEALDKRNSDAPWYRQSAASDAEALNKRNANADAPWYRQSAASDAEALDERNADADAPWYRQSAASDSEALGKRNTDAPWYRQSAASDSEAIGKRDVAQDKFQAIRSGVFENLRGEHLRQTIEKGKAFFSFKIKPMSDEVDRWHIPNAIAKNYNEATTDAERVSSLNWYLFETGREPKSAKELGFKPTMVMPGLPEKGNEVGFGYALAGQHQSHCADILADAIEIGKTNLRDFYLFHVVHCLSLIKIYSGDLTMKEPIALLTPEAEAIIKGNYSMTIE